MVDLPNGSIGGRYGDCGTGRQEVQPQDTQLGQIVAVTAEMGEELLPVLFPGQQLAPFRADPTVPTGKR